MMKKRIRLLLAAGAAAAALTACTRADTDNGGMAGSAGAFPGAERSEHRFPGDRSG